MDSDRDRHSAEHASASLSPFPIPIPYVAPLDQLISEELRQVNSVAKDLGDTLAFVYKKILEAVRYFGRLDAVATHFPWLLAQLLENFNIDAIVKHAVLLSYYIRQLPRFIELNLLFLKKYPDKMYELFDVFDLPYLKRGKADGPSAFRQSTWLYKYATDFSSMGRGSAAWASGAPQEGWMREWLAQTQPHFSGRTGAEYAPAHTGLSEVLRGLVNGNTSWMALVENFARGHVLSVTAKVIQGIPLHIRNQFHLLTRHVDALFSGDPNSPTGRLFHPDSLSFVLNKMMSGLHGFFAKASTEQPTADGLPGLELLLDTLGPFGALCLQAALGPVSQGLVSVAADMVGYFMMLMDTPITVPIISNIVVGKAHGIFSSHPRGMELLMPTTTLLHWVCILSVAHLMYMGSHRVLHSNRHMDLATYSLPTVEPAMAKVWIESEGELRALVDAALGLEANLTQTTDARFGPRTIYLDLSDCERVKASYWFGSVVATCHVIESRLAVLIPDAPLEDRSTATLINAMLRLPIQFLRLVVSFPMAPRLDDTLYPGPRARLLEQLNKDKIDLYQAQRGAWVFSLADVVYRLIYLPQPGSSGPVPYGPTLGYCLGALPHLMISFWCHYKKMLILISDTVSRTLNSVYVDQGLVAIRDPYQTWTANDLLHQHLPDVIHAPFGQVSREAALSVLTFFQRHSYGQSQSEHYDACLSPLTHGYHLPASTQSTSPHGPCASQLLTLLSNARGFEAMAPWPVLNYVKHSLALLGPSAFAAVGGFESPAESVPQQLASMTWGVLFNAMDRCIQFQAYDPVLLGSDKARPTAPIFKAPLPLPPPRPMPSPVPTSLPPPLPHFNLTQHLMPLMQGPRLEPFPQTPMYTPSNASHAAPLSPLPTTAPATAPTSTPALALPMYLGPPLQAPEPKPAVVPTLARSAPVSSTPLIAIFAPASLPAVQQPSLPLLPPSPVSPPSLHALPLVGGIPVVALEKSNPSQASATAPPLVYVYPS